MNKNRLQDKHLLRLVRLLGIKVAQRCNKLSVTRRKQIIMPAVKRLARYRADVYGDNEQEVVKELEYLCGLV